MTKKKMTKKQSEALLQAFKFHGQGVYLQRCQQPDDARDIMKLRDEAMIAAGLPDWKALTGDIANEDGPFAPRP